MTTMTSRERTVDDRPVCVSGASQACQTVNDSHGMCKNKFPHLMTCPSGAGRSVAEAQIVAVAGPLASATVGWKAPMALPRWSTPSRACVLGIPV